MLITLVMLALSPLWRLVQSLPGIKRRGGVRVGDLLCEVETDKATWDYDSTTEVCCLRSGS
jgi:hypothetical protein